MCIRDSQNEAALIARGIEEKLLVHKAERQETDEQFLEVISNIRRQFGAVWDKQSLNVIVSGPDGGPLEMDHTVKSPMDIKALNDAIKRDQERPFTLGLPIERHQRPIKLWPPVAKQAPRIARSRNRVEIDGGRDHRFLIAPRISQDFTRRSRNERRAVKSDFASFANLAPDPIRRDQRHIVRTCMPLHHTPPVRR